MFFEAVVPVPLRSPQMMSVIHKELKKAAKEIKKDFSKTTRTWKHRPRMEMRIGAVKQLMLGGAALDMDVGPWEHHRYYDIYTYVDLGTKGPYPIPKPGNTTAKTLHFRWGGYGSYRAKTSRRVLGAKSGGPTGPMVSFKHVTHPGIEGRAFSETIAVKWNKKILHNAGRAMEKACAVSLHEIL